MDAQTLVFVMTVLIAMVFSLSVHEAAHAWMAKVRGDDTAESMGRLTLNPVPHIDPIGTVIMPAIASALSPGALFGWAKPVPVDLRNVKNPRWDNVLISAAGPVSNLILCAICLVLLAIHEVYLASIITESNFFFPLIKLLQVMAGINAILAFFNLIPLPPLDGAAVLSGFLPERMAEAYDNIVRPYGMFILIGLLFSGYLSIVWQAASVYLGTVKSLIFLIIG